MQKSAAEIIQQALNLDGSPDKLLNLYKDWANRYDDDVAAEQYTAPTIITSLLTGLAPSATLDPNDKTLRIMDAGCGTGLVGQVLHSLGYTNLHGLDFSPAMVEEAAKLGIYKTLVPNVDLNAPLGDTWQTQYDVTFCCGVFTPGHVFPPALDQLIAMTKPGGVMLVSTRTTYCEAEPYEATHDDLIQKGRIKLVKSLLDAPYTVDGNSHYWVYAVL